MSTGGGDTHSYRTIVMLVNKKKFVCNCPAYSWFETYSNKNQWILNEWKMSREMKNDGNLKYGPKLSDPSMQQFSDFYLLIFSLN